MSKFYPITFFNKIFQIVWTFSVFTYFRSIFGTCGGDVCLVVYGFSETFALVSPYFVNGIIFINQSLLLFFNRNPVFLTFPAFFRKVEEMLHFQIVCNGNILVPKKLTNITKTKNDMLCVMSLPPLRNLSSRFAVILVYAQFLSLPLCEVTVILAASVSDYRVSYTAKTKSIFRRVLKLNTFYSMKIQQKI